MTKIEIINETLAFYSEDPSRRAVTSTACHYYHKTANGIEKKCSVGRCMTDQSILEDGLERGPIYELVNQRNVDDILKPEYQGHPVDFWSDLQRFHDNDGYWTKDGISKDGVIACQNLLETYKD